MSCKKIIAIRNRTDLLLHSDPKCKLYEIYHYCVYSEIILIIDRGIIRNMYSFISKICLKY